MATLGPQPDSWLEARGHCGYNPQPERSPAGDCGRPAALHIKLAGDDGFVATCGEHASAALTRLPALEWHDWRAVCDMPGLWHPSTTAEVTDSFCDIDDSGVEPQLVAMAEVTP